MATTTDYLTQLQTDKQTLVDNLVEKGVEASNEETFTTLVPKVAEIQSGANFDEYFMDTIPIGASNCSGLNKAIIKTPPLSFNGTDMSYMFSRCTNLVTVDTSNFDTSNVSNMAYAFDNCSHLVSLDLSNSRTGQAATASYAFRSCQSLVSLDLSGFLLDNLSYAFSLCKSLVDLKVSINDTCSLSACPLSAESVSYILQNLGPGIQTSAKVLTLGENNLAKATEEDLTSATEKGWTIN